MGRKWYKSYFGSRDDLGLRVLFQASIFMMISVIFIFWFSGLILITAILFYCLMYMHMSCESSKYLLNVVGQLIEKRMHDFIKPSYQQNDFAFYYIVLIIVATNNLKAFQQSTVVNKMCLTIWNYLKKQYEHRPRTTDDWKILPKIFMRFSICPTVLDP